MARGRATRLGAGLRPPQPAQRWDVWIRADVGVGGQPGPLAGELRRSAQAAQLVDEAPLQSVRPGPDASAGDLVDAPSAEPPAVRHFAGEVVVDAIEGLLQPLPLLVAVPGADGEHPGVPAGHD